MSPEEDSDDYDDPIRLIDFEQRRVQKFGTDTTVTEFDAADSDGEVLIQKNITVPQPRKKVTVSLPVTFFDIPRNVKLLRKCQPFVIKVVKCDKYPWYHRKYLKKSSTVNDDSKSKDNNPIVPKTSSEVCEQDMTKLKIRPVDTPYPVLKTCVAKQNHLIIGKQSNCAKETVQCVKENKNNTPLIPKNPTIDFKKNQGLVGLKLTKLTSNTQSVEFGIVLNESKTQNSECHNVVNVCNEALRSEDKCKQNIVKRKEVIPEEITEKEVKNKNVDIPKDNEFEKKNTVPEEITKKLKDESLKIKVVANEDPIPKANTNECLAKTSFQNLEQKQKDALLIGTKIKPNPDKDLPDPQISLKQIHQRKNTKLKEVPSEKVQSNPVHIENKVPCVNDKQCNVNDLYVGQVVKNLTTDKNPQKKTRRRKVKPESIYNNKNALNMVLFKPEKKTSAKSKCLNDKPNESKKNRKSKKKDQTETDLNKNIVKPVMEDTNIINPNLKPETTVAAKPKPNDVEENKVISGHTKLNFGALHLQKCTPVKLSAQKENEDTIKIQKTYSNANSTKKSDARVNTIQNNKNLDMPDLNLFGTDICTNNQNTLEHVVENQVPKPNFSKPNPTIPSQKDNMKSSQGPVPPPSMISLNALKTRIGHIEHIKVLKQSLVNEKPFPSTVQKNTQSPVSKKPAVNSKNVPSNKELRLTPTVQGSKPTIGAAIVNPPVPLPSNLSSPTPAPPAPPPPQRVPPPPPPPPTSLPLVPPLPTTSLPFVPPPLPTSLPLVPPPPPTSLPLVPPIPPTPASIPNQNTPANRHVLPQIPLMLNPQTLPLTPTSLNPAQKNIAQVCPPEGVPQMSPTQNTLQQKNVQWTQQGQPMPSIPPPPYLPPYSTSNYNSGTQPILSKPNINHEIPQPYVTVNIPAKSVACNGNVNGESTYGAQMQTYKFINNNQTIHMHTMQRQQNSNCAPRIIRNKSIEGINAMMKFPSDSQIHMNIAQLNMNANMNPNNCFRLEQVPKNTNIGPSNMPFNQNMVQNRVPTMNCNIRHQSVQNQQYPVYNIPTLSNRTSGQANIIAQQNFRPMTPQQHTRYQLNNNTRQTPNACPAGCYYRESVSEVPPRSAINLNVWPDKMSWDCFNPAPTLLQKPAEPNRNPLPTPNLNQNNSVTSKSVAGTTIIGENISGPVRKININAGAPVNGNKTDPLIEMNEITPLSSKREMLEELCRATSAISPSQSPKGLRHIPGGPNNPPISTTTQSDWKITPLNSNSPKNSGYSPPILPIPTFQSTYAQFSCNTNMNNFNNNGLAESVYEQNQTTEINLKRKIEDDDPSSKYGKKISLDEYKKRVSQNVDSVPETDRTEVFIKKEIKSENTELDLGYASDSTTKL